jgi:inner membrane protein involved in colicin E2 resistance
VKRCVSLSEVARSNWPHGNVTGNFMQKHKSKSQNTITQIWANEFRVLAATVHVHLVQQNREKLFSQSW